MKPSINFYFFLFLLGSSLMFTACGDDDVPTPENEEELITTLQLALVPDMGGNTVTMEFKDLDGDGADPAVITNGTLTANTTYTGTITLLNEEETPAEDITLEVKDEAAEHQFFYQVGAGLNLVVSYGDSDPNGNPIGVETEMVTGDAGIGSLTITLIHEPEKAASGVANGDITNAGGETDIAVTFEVTVQ